MTNVYYQEDDQLEPQRVSIESEETLLDGLLRTGHKVPFGCKEGICQSCLMTAPDKNAPKEAVCGLTPNQIEQGAFLSCRCIPTDGFRANSTDLSGQLVEAKVLEISALNANIFRLRVEKVIDYKPGQFVTLWNNENIARSYSIASHPNEDEYIEFHIKRVTNGAFSEWAWDNLSIGDTLRIQGPIGQCYYGNQALDIPLVLSGMGTGLAPLIGIARDALSNGHTGEIHMLIAARDSDNLYLVSELNTLQSRHKNIHLSLIVQNSTSEQPLHSDIIEGDVYQVVKDSIGSFKDHMVYLCGAESFVKKMKKLCFLGGANMKDILADPFIPFQK
ncbi:MAG: 2Fe-2S iron-sulfur cluster binding domain-containing protein [Agarilytica sp.]